MKRYLYILAFCFILGGCKDKQKPVEAEEIPATVTEHIPQEKVVVESGELCVVEFYASWCGPCKKFSPIVDQFQKDNPTISVRRVDIDSEPAEANKYEIYKIPCTIILKNGKEIERKLGGQTLQELTDWILTFNK